MSSFRLFLASLCLLSLPFQVRAQNVGFQNLDENSFKQVIGDLSTNFLHTSVSGASTLGEIFGFEIGVVGGSANSPHVNDLAHQADPSANAAKMYDAAVLGALTVPLGITAEIAILPRAGPDNFRFANFGAAVKWTPTEVFGDLPLSLAIKLAVNRTSIDFSQSQNNTLVNYAYVGNTTNLMFLASKNFAIVEPYVGLGWVRAKGDLTANGSSTVFDANYTAANSASTTRTGGALVLGAELKLLVVKLGAEYTRMFDTSRVMGKLSVFF